MSTTAIIVIVVAIIVVAVLLGAAVMAERVAGAAACGRALDRSTTVRPMRPVAPEKLKWSSGAAWTDATALLSSL